MMDFMYRVLFLTTQIPAGRVTSYKEIARSLGNTGFSRAVGNALNKNPYPGRIPCHRVVRSNGEVGGFIQGVEEKIRLLESEGIVIEKNRVKDLRKILFKAEEMRKP
ncbi:MAG: MGMT family protein [Candidatus Altiarchaeota archaeon]|nr:MGMT family protein [Candidatus Altiarchaeota archaeon]